MDELLQPSLRGDSRMENLARLIAELSALPVSVPIVNLFDIVDSSALASLAEQFHVMGDEGWNLAATEAARRSLLKKAIELHRYKGTRWAVRNALETVLERSVNVQEWFEYEGEPYFFRVCFDVGAGLDETSLKEVFRLVYENKNVRSWLECLETGSTILLPMHVGAGLAGLTATRPRLWFQPPPPVSLPRRTEMLATHVTASRLWACSPFHPAPPLYVSAGVAVRAITKFRLGIPGSGDRYVR